MKQVRIPQFLHDVFGVKQSMGAIIIILLFGGALTSAVFLKSPEIYHNISLWRSMLAYILIFDIFSGCIANFTASTSNYYAAYKGKRIVFIAIHVHLLLVALLLNTDIWQSTWVWSYTIIGAFLVNAMRGRHQLFTAGLLFSAGLGWIPMLYGIEPYMLIVSLVFMLKVLLSFSVDHYGKTLVKYNE